MECFKSKERKKNIKKIVISNFKFDFSLTLNLIKRETYYYIFYTYQFHDIVTQFSLLFQSFVPYFLNIMWFLTQNDICI